MTLKLRFTIVRFIWSMIRSPFVVALIWLMIKHLILVNIQRILFFFVLVLSMIYLRLLISIKTLSLFCVSMKYRVYCLMCNCTPCRLVRLRRFRDLIVQAHESGSDIFAQTSILSLEDIPNEISNEAQFFTSSIYPDSTK